MKTGFLVTGLVLLLVTTILMSIMVTPRVGAEGFANCYLANAADVGAKPIGAFDGIRLESGNPGEPWRYTAPNEAPSQEFKLGPDNLFMFKYNQVKPECCGATYSGNGGCICTTHAQRKFLNERGGNRTVPDDGV